MWSTFQVTQKASNGLIAITQLGQMQGWRLLQTLLPDLRLMIHHQSHCYVSLQAPNPILGAPGRWNSPVRLGIRKSRVFIPLSPPTI